MFKCQQNLRLTLFGVPTVTLNEESLTGALTGKLLALFLYLAVTAANGKPLHNRDAVADLFWSELPKKQRRSNLRYLLADLRQIVDAYLIITRHTVGFNCQAPYWMDVAVLRTTLGAAAGSLTSTEIQAALALYRGEFLDGFRVRNAPLFDQWVAEQRRALHDLVTQATLPAPNNPPKHNLPSQLTPFFGREQEITNILTHLNQDGYRLLTIIGAGGIGKTRLALAVAHAILDFRFWMLDTDAAQIQNQPFPDGIWFVSLADLTPTADLPDQLATAIAKALDFPLSGQGAPTMQLYHYLAHKQMVLLLDNFEQLAAHADFLVTLLQKASAIRLIVTSRQQLHLQAEYPWRLTGLPAPPVAQVADLAPAELLQYAGVALFVERARRAYPQFQLAQTNQRAVVEICHLLDGLPLGIELAAALCKEYTCDEVLTALYADYAVLKTNLPDFSVRHRNLKTVLAHSWRLLDEDTAHILAACAIFQGGFTPAAAVAVTGATVAVLQRLVEHSLLHINRDETAGWRYDFHDVVRRYAREQLTHLSAWQAQVQAAHAAYYLSQLQQAAPLLLQDAIAQAEIDREIENIATAWQRCIAEGWIDLLAQSVEGLATFYRLAGLHSAAYQLFQPALALARQAPPSHDRIQTLLAALLINLSEICRYLDRLEEAETLAQEACALGRRRTDAVIQCRAYHELARVAQRRAQHTIMRDWMMLACTLAHQAGDMRLQAMSRNALGVAYLLLGDFVAAIHQQQAALACLAHEVDQKLKALIVSNLGVAYTRCREYSMAVHFASEALTLAQLLNDRYGMAIAHTSAGNLWLDLGAFAAAQSAYDHALSLFAEIRDPYWETLARSGQAFLWQLRGNHTAAAQVCRDVLSLVQGKMPLLEHRVLTYLGDARWALGDVQGSEALYRRALALQHETQLTFRLAEPLFRLALLLLQERNDALAAQALLEEPLHQMRTQGYAVVAEPFGMYYAGYCVLQANGDSGAAQILQQAQALFQEALAKIANTALHQSFLESIPWRRALWTLVQAHCQ